MIAAEVVAAQNPWWKVLYVVLSNLSAIPAIVEAYTRGREDPRFRFFYYYIGTYVTISMVVSMLYHTCQSASLCFAATFNAWHVFDHIFANYVIALGIQLFIERSNTIWLATVPHVYLALVVFAVFAYPFDINASVLTVAFGFSILYIKYVLVDHGRRPHIHPTDKTNVTPGDQFDYASLVIALILIGIGGLFYMFDDTRYYDFLHANWHIFIYLALFFLIHGTSKDTINWHSIPELITDVENWAYATRKTLAASIRLQ